MGVVVSARVAKALLVVGVVCSVSILSGIASVQATPRAAVSGPDRELLDLSPEWPASSVMAAGDKEVEVPESVVRGFSEVFPEVDESQFRKSLGTELARADLTSALVTREAFGGQWYDFQTLQWHVAATDDALLNWVSERAAEAEVPTIVEKVSYSYADLSKVKDEIDRALHTAGLRDWENSVVPADNKVGVRVLASDLALLKPWASDNRVEIGVVDSFPDGTLASCVNRWNCSTPLAGGINIASSANQTDVGDPGCTLGFTALKAQTGQRYAYTAGHCITTAQVAASTVYWAGTHSIGDARLTFSDATGQFDTDAALVGITNAYWLSTSGGFLQTSLANTSDVDGRMSSLAEMSAGQVVCSLGRSFGAGRDNCGVLPLPPWSPRPKVNDIYTCGGDSGGSVYRYLSQFGVRTAYGLISSSSSRGADDCTPNGGTGTWMAFSPLPAINNSMDAYTDYNIRVEIR